MQGNLLTVCTVDPNDPVDMVFSVSEDRTQMTAELMNGRIIATLKRISHDFSIKDFLNAKPVQDAYTDRGMGLCESGFYTWFRN